VFPKIGGKPPKWMVKIMENPTKMDDLGVFPYFRRHPYLPYPMLTQEARMKLHGSQDGLPEANKKHTPPRKGQRWDPYKWPKINGETNIAIENPPF